MELAARRPDAAPRHLRILDAPSEPAAERRNHPVDVEIVVPVYNEAAHLAERIHTLRTFLDQSFPFSSLVTIVDNGSLDGTAVIASQLAATLPGVSALSLSRKGRGFALRTAWSSSNARVVAYMDVDLSTSLSALLPLVAPLLSGHGQVSIGTRLGRGARVVRGPKRELISRLYNLLLRLSLRSHVTDAQCGFKAVERHAALELLPLVEDNEWFFDTELLVTAERLGLRIDEVPVDWVDDPDSRVHILSTAVEDLRGVWRMSHRRVRARTRVLRRKDGPPDLVTADQLLSFAGVGVLSTLSYLFLFASGRSQMGTLGANAAALAVCTFFNTSIHRTLAQRLHEPDGSAAGRPRFIGVVTGLFAISLALTTAALVVAGITSGGSLTADVVGVTVANGLAAVVRFVILRAWVFRPGPATADHLGALA
jgi:glycosyltransferase involved in cell wall biosynthesis